MTPRPRKPWREAIDESGAHVIVFERTAGSVLYRDVVIDGKRDRKSLGHRDRRLAVDQGRALAKRLAELRLAGQTRAVSLGQVSALFRAHRLPHLAPARQLAVTSILDLLERGIGRDVAVDDLAQHHVDGYVAARRAGTLRTAKHYGEGGVTVATILNELAVLRAILRWGRTYRQGGRRLLTVNPLEGLTLPQVKNVRRPVATEERFRKLLAVAGRVDRRGRFACVLSLARFTGRRISAICQLRRSDVLLTQEAVEAALSGVGQPVAHATHWPCGALLWRAATDKTGTATVAPLGREARAALDAYLARHAVVGDAPLFPGAQTGETLRRRTAADWLHRAEKLAGLPRLEGGVFHPLRRLWASERRHLPAQDVADAGGWKSLRVMQVSYQHSDAATMFSVTDSPAGRRTSGTPKRQPKAR